MLHGVCLWDDEPLCNVGGVLRHSLSIAENSHRLRPVDSCTLDLRCHLELLQLRLIRRIEHIGTHVIQALSGLFGALKAASGTLVVGLAEAPCAVMHINPTVQAAQVEDLPGLQRERLALLNATQLDALRKPLDYPVGTGRVEYIRKFLRALPLEVSQMPLAGFYLIRAAHIMQLAVGHLLCVHAHRMVQAGLLAYLSHASTPIVMGIWQRRAGTRRQRRH